MTNFGKRKDGRFYVKDPLEEARQRQALVKQAEQSFLKWRVTIYRKVSAANSADKREHNYLDTFKDFNTEAEANSFASGKDNVIGHFTNGREYLQIVKIEHIRLVPSAFQASLQSGRSVFRQ